VVLAQADRKTLILDCDLRRPSLHEIFGLRNVRGLVDVVAGGNEPGRVWREPLANLKLITSGSIPPNPTELLGSKRFSEFLSGIRREFDYVLLDAPPVGLVSDPSILASQGDGVLLVLDAQKTRKAALRQSRRSLEAVGAKVFGTVMSNVGGSTAGYYGKQAYK
jgi:receptor protein-tyrosine kinase